VLVANGAALRGAFVLACGLALVAQASGAAPPALYASAQAQSGARTYAQVCAGCHGESLEGGVGPALRGPNLVRLAKKTKLTVGDVFSFLALQMPLNAPATLSHDQYAAVMAYILKENGYPAGSKPLSYDAAMHSTVVMTTYSGTH
jgi:mono/diheme cytochrome c family protein